MAEDPRRQRTPGKSWYRIQAKADGPTRVDLYDDIGFWGVTAQEFLADIRQIDGPIELHINSPGGDVFDGMTIYNNLVQRGQITTVVDGIAASAAATIMMAGDERLGHELSQVMIHDPWSGVDGNAADLTAMAGRLEATGQQMAVAFSRAAGGSPEDWRALMKATTYYTADEAMDAGLLTGVIISDRAPAPPAVVPAASIRRVPGEGQIAAGASSQNEPETGRVDAPDIEDGGQEAIRAAVEDGNNGWVQRDNQWVFDPDGDGDDDSQASTDTDHDYWDENGKQIKAIPENPATGTPAQPVPNSKASGPVVQAADVDNSPWDARKAWANGAAADDKAAFYAAITAGRRSGEPADTQAAYALPYRYTPDSAPNAEGVRQALSRLPQTEGLSNEAAARTKLEGLMKEINPDYEPPASSAAGPEPGAAPAPRISGRMSAQGKDGAMPDAWTIEGRRSRVGEIDERLQEMARDYPSSALPEDLQEEWRSLLAEQRDHATQLAAVDARNQELATAALLAGRRSGDLAQAGGFTTDGPRAGSEAAQPGAAPAASPVFGAPAFHQVQDNIYDLAAIRQRARTFEDMPRLMRDNAMRAVERAHFPGLDSREDAQGNVAKLLTKVPDAQGIIAQRILVTGSPDYVRVFGKAIALGNPAMLSTKDQQILGALGTSTNSGADGGYAVPFELDPSVTLTSDGSINPLRDMATVRQITTKELDLVNTAGVTVSRVAENTEASDNSPTLSQPTVKPQRVQGFIPFSVEIEGDWAGLQAEMFALLQDAKDQEEATGANGFVLGDGSGNHAAGLIGTFGTAYQVQTAASATFAVADVYAVKNAVGPRFRARGQFLSDSAIYDLVRQFGTGTMANVWTDLGGDRPPQLIGYPARELSTMDATTVTGKKIIVFGDFKSGFLIVDRVGMNMELVPHLFGSSNRYPTGQRGYYVWWRNNSLIRNNAAMRMLVVK